MPVFILSVITLLQLWLRVQKRANQAITGISNCLRITVIFVLFKQRTLGPIIKFDLRSLDSVLVETGVGYVQCSNVVESKSFVHHVRGLQKICMMKKL